MSTTLTITYRKTQSGEWVAYGPADIVRPGATITVTKRDGSTKSETVSRVGKTFQVDGRPMIYGYLSTAKAKTTPRGGACDECGRHGATHECVDSSGIAGLCCDRCARMSRYERSFA